MPIVRWLNQNIDQRFQWRAAAGFSWLAQTAMTEQEIPDSYRSKGIACFEVPLIAAVKAEKLTASKVADLSVAATANGSKKIPDDWAPKGVRRYWYGPWMKAVTCCVGGRPRRNDVVYFWARGAGYFAHVAIATGNGSNVISFGHYEQGRNDTDTSRTLELTTIEDLVNEHVQHRNHLAAFDAVYYGPGPWG